MNLRRRENLSPLEEGGRAGTSGGPPSPWKERLTDEEPEVLDILMGIVRGRRPASDASASIKRVPIGERRQAAEFLFQLFHGQPKQTLESDWPTNMTIHVKPTDIGPGRKG